MFLTEGLVEELVFVPFLRFVLVSTQCFILMLYCYLCSVPHSAELLHPAPASEIEVLRICSGLPLQIRSAAELVEVKTLSKVKNQLSSVTQRTRIW